MTQRVFIIHGWGDAPNDGWKPWLNNELCSRGMVVRTPTMPNTHLPDCNRWVQELKKIVGVHIGQAGVQMGNAYWELFCLEHGIQQDTQLYNDKPKRRNDDCFNTFFSETQSGFTLFLMERLNVDYW